MDLLFLFLDGVGLGKVDPDINPFIRANMPHLRELLGGWHLASEINLPLVTSRATLLPLDPCLGKPGLPQSATGQASLFTGQNIPALIGYHYGPKPNQAVANHLKNGNLFSVLSKAGISVALLNAFPPRYFYGIKSGIRLPGAIAMAAYHAGIQLMTVEDLHLGNAISADLTGIGWREHLGFSDTPLITPLEAGWRLAKLGGQFQFSIFEYWLSDIAGHRQDIDKACQLLETFDQALGGLLNAWNDAMGLILLVSDHGNLEDLSTRHHTLNPVPLLLVGSPILRHQFVQNMQRASTTTLDLTHIYPAILQMFIGQLMP